LLFGCAIIWGASYVLIKLSLEDFDGTPRLAPFELGANRMFLASLFLLPFAIKNLKKIKKSHWPFLTIAGFCGNGFPAFLFAYAQNEELDSAITGMLNSFVPIWAITIAAIVFSFKLRWNHLVGIILGIIGVSVIMSGEMDNINFSEIEWFPFICVMIATLCYGISLNTIKYKLVDLSPITITSISFNLVGIPCLLYLISTGFFTDLYNIPAKQDGYIYLIILSLVGTTLAVYLFNHLIKVSSPAFASSVTYFIPVIATLLGVAIGEQLLITHILGMVILVMGVFLINKKVANVRN